MRVNSEFALHAAQGLVKLVVLELAWPPQGLQRQVT